MRHCRRGLEELIDFQEYPVKAAEISTLARRSLGIGYIGLAHYLAKNKVKYNDPEALQLVHDLTERFQFYLLKASNQIAKEKGKCEYFDRTKYSDGILPIDTYKTPLMNLLNQNTIWTGMDLERIFKFMDYDIVNTDCTNAVREF